MKRHITWLGCALIAAVAVGCAKNSTTESKTASQGPSTEGRKYLLSAEPEDAQDIIAAREEAEDDQEVTIIGRIGGSVDPWVEGRAAFSLVDRSLASCSDIPGDQCPTPWDYCCVTDKLPGATALVKVVDADGQIIGTDARELLGLEELQTVVVQGKAERDDSGNMTILASAIYPHKGDMGQFPPSDAAAHAEHDHDHDHAQDHDADHAHDAEEEAAEPTTDQNESES